MKSDPSLDLLPSILGSQRGKDFISGLRRRALADKHDRANWLIKTDHYRRRRYCMEFRDPEYPWPGSSSIVMPLIDKKIDELKPQYVNLVTGANPPVTVLGIDRESHENASNLELWFTWLIKFGSPGFIEEVALAVDDLLETGRGILKSTWFYETRKSTEVISKAALPDRLQQLIVTKNGVADKLHQMTGGQVPLLEMGEFERVRPLIGEIIKKEFDLDPEEPQDRDAYSQVMRWLRSGATEKLLIQKRDTVLNLPGVVAIHPRYLILPPNSSSDIEDAERITEEMWFTRVQIAQKARDGEWNKESVKALLEPEEKPQGRRTYSMEEADEALREGVNAMTHADQFCIYQSCAWYSTSESGPLEKVVILWHEKSDIPLKAVSYVRPSGRWPYHSATFEHNKDRWYAPRGIPEKIDDIDFEITKQHRYKLNRAEIATAPTIKAKPGPLINPSTWRWIPGQIMFMNNPSLDAMPMEWPQLDVVFEKEEQNLLTWVEQFLGGTDFGLSNPLSRMSEPRTATEISAIGNRARQSLSMRGMLFQRMMMQPVYREMLNLFMAYGDDVSFINVSQGAPVRLTKEEMQGQFTLQPTGTIGETDPATEAQQDLMKLQVMAQLAPMIGDGWELDIGEVFSEWFEKSNPGLAKRALRKRSPQEVQQIQQQRADQMAAQQAMAMAGGKSGGPSGGKGGGPPAPTPPPGAWAQPLTAAGGPQ